MGQTGRTWQTRRTTVLLFCSFVVALTSRIISTDAASCLAAERDALLAFKAGITEDSQNVISGWAATVDCCSWWGVQCDNKGHVVQLDLYPGDDTVNLDAYFFTGTISSSLAALPRLQYLDLSYAQNLTGEIPVGIGNLVHVTFLNLRKNKLTGPIPTTLGHLPNLEFIDLAYNQLTGSIPDFVGPHINYLMFSGNSLTGTIPASLGRLSNITWLYIDQNELTGGIPEALTQLAATLQFVDFSQNKLTGKLPTNLGDLTHIQNLDFSSNGLTGPIPASIGKIKGLGNLRLNNNKLSGHIPAILATLKDLVGVDLSYNRLTGPIPQGAPFSTFPSDYFAGNPGLCASPLPACKHRRLL